MKYLGPSPPCGVCQLMSCVGTLMSQVLQWMQLGRVSGVQTNNHPGKWGAEGESLTSAR